MSTRTGLGLRRAMRCMACGAEMCLVGVSLTDTPMAGFERHTLKCSTCSHVSRRLVLSPRPPIANLSLVAHHPEPPATRLQNERVVVPSAAQDPAAPSMSFNWVEVFEKHRSQHTPIQGRLATARVSSTLKAIEGRRSQPPATQEASAPPRSSTWPEAVEKVRRRQIALRESATATSTPLSVSRGPSRTTAADANAQRGNKAPSRTWEEDVDDLRRRLAALTEQAASSMRAEPADPERAPAAPSGNSTPLQSSNDPAAPQSGREAQRFETPRGGRRGF
jgi:hypothetical protein